MKLRRSALALGSIAALTVLAACGTTSPATDETTTATGEPITVTDSEGNDVTLADGPAQRVVALEWAQAEIMTSLGIDLVGVSDVAGYTSWVGAAVPLIGDPTDVGQRTEPSVETIADLEPDLIVGVARSIPDAVRSQMEQIAPVLLLENANAADPLGAVTDSVTTLATTVGRQDEGAALLDDFTATLDANKARIDAAGRTGTEAVFTSPYEDAGNVSIRMHGPGSAPQAVMSAIGLAPAWTDAGDEAYGLSYTDVEGLTTLPADSWFLYWANADEDNPVTTFLEPNAVWQSLPFVRDNRVEPAAEGIWVYGGPKSLAAFSDDVADKLGA